MTDATLYPSHARSPASRMDPTEADMLRERVRELEEALKVAWLREERIRSAYSAWVRTGFARKTMEEIGAALAGGGKP